MAIGIEATFLLGTFTGHRPDGSPDQLPDPARLHAALLNAAGQGSTAVHDKSGLHASAKAIAALEWLDANPPTGIRLPRVYPVAALPITAFRREGVIRKEGGAWTDKIGGRPFSDGYAVDGPVGWCWDHGIPEAVRAALEELCADVGCLGEATSPVRLVVTDIEPTHSLDSGASIFVAGGTDLRVPTTGRTAALTAAHTTANGKSPSIAGDRHKTDENPSPPTPTRQAVESRRYRPRGGRADRCTLGNGGALGHCTHDPASAPSPLVHSIAPRSHRADRFRRAAAHHGCLRKRGPATGKPISNPILAGRDARTARDGVRRFRFADS